MVWDLIGKGWPGRRDSNPEPLLLKRSGGEFRTLFTGPHKIPHSLALGVTRSDYEIGRIARRQMGGKRRRLRGQAWILNREANPFRSYFKTGCCMGLTGGSFENLC